MAKYSLKSSIEVYRINRALGLPRLLSLAGFLQEQNMRRLSSFLVNRFYPNWPEVNDPPSDLPFEEQTRFFWRRKKDQQ
jgi:hypothetical protein